MPKFTLKPKAGAPAAKKEEEVMTVSQEPLDMEEDEQPKPTAKKPARSGKLTHAKPLLADDEEEAEEGEEEAPKQQVKRNAKPSKPVVDEDDELPVKKPASRKPASADDEDDSWAVMGADIDKALKQREAAQASKYRPEFYLKDGDAKNIIFRGFISMVDVHTVKTGKFFNKHTCASKIRKCKLCTFNARSANPKKCAVGNAYPVFVWEVIDLTPYENKDGKQVKESRKFWAPTHKIHKFIETYIQRKGLTDRDLVEFVCSIEKVDTNYLLDLVRMDDAIEQGLISKKQLARIAEIPTFLEDGEWKKFWRPETDEQHQLIIDSLGYSSVDDDEDD